jgi:DNA-binding LytR/AlgR family response regulator
MNVLIIEDEQPAIDSLINCIHATDSSIAIAGTTTGVTDTVQWLRHNPAPDVMLMDIELADGLSFNIFKEAAISCPVIFITAYNKYLMQAFEYNSIDYLLKPVDLVKLGNTLRKYKNLQHHFISNYSSLVDYLQDTRKNKTRIIVKKGTEFQAVKMDDIVYFFSEHKVVFVVDKENRKYLCETPTLSELEEILDNKKFYRANRKYIISANYLLRYKSVDKSKLSLELTLPLHEEIIVSQESAAAFKKWISEI